MRTLLWMAMLLSYYVSFAQIDPAHYSMSWYGRDKNDTLPSLVTATRTADNFYNTDHKNHTIDSLLQNKAFGRHRPPHTYYVETYDSSEAHFFADRITAANAGNYEYRVLLNAHTPLVPWSPLPYAATAIPAPEKNTGKLNWLGAYKAGFGNYLVIDLRKKGTDSIISYTLVFWQPAKPVLLNIYTADELNEFLKRLSSPQSYTLSGKELKKWRTLYPPYEFDPTNLLPKKLVLSPGNNSLIFYLKADIKKSTQVEYQLLRDDEIYIDWKTNDFDQPFIWLKNMPPGQYRLHIRYPIQRLNVTTYPFEIKKAWYQTNAFKLIEGALVAAFVGFILLLLLNYRQKRKLRKEQQKKERLETEIRALRAQLNPHFIFNALSSIQGLINNGEIDSANNYLADFANLMRDVLNEKNNENNVLENEIQTLDSYLKLEQLRFHFTYHITIASTIQPSDVQVPTLLLQPLVENAVKHGVSHLQEKGAINISFEQHNSDMLVNITDNGNGFDASNTPYGYGLQLTKRRIIFANKILKGQAIFMKIQSGKGTSVHLTFQNWLA